MQWRDAVDDHHCLIGGNSPDLIPQGVVAKVFKDNDIAAGFLIIGSEVTFRHGDGEVRGNRVKEGHFPLVEPSVVGNLPIFWLIVGKFNDQRGRTGTIFSLV